MTPTTWRSRASSVADADPAPLRAARERILGDIVAAARRVGRDPDGVRVVAVAKTVSAARIAAALEAGFDAIGENRVQEADAKVAELAAMGALERRAPAWHLVGPLQSNKARRAVELFDVIQTVDSVPLAARLGRIAGEVRPDRGLPILLQVNVDADPGKAGFAADDVDRALEPILGFPHLRVDGLMTVGRLGDRPDAARPTFVALRRLAERLRTAWPALGAELSMGMTDDFAIAVEEGATIVRIGRAIFGARPTVR